MVGGCVMVEGGDVDVDRDRDGGCKTVEIG